MSSVWNPPGSISPIPPVAYPAIKGDGITNDTAALLRVMQSNTYVQLPCGVVCLISPMKFDNLVNLTLDLNGSTLLVTCPTPTAAGQATALSFKSDLTYGNSRNIKVINGRITWLTAPNARVDSNFGVFGDGINGIEISGVEIDHSWGAGIWIQRSNNIIIKKNHIHDCEADGATVQNCGSNLQMRYNMSHDNGDDLLAVTWFSGGDPAYVGLTDGILQTQEVAIENNICYNGEARGIFLGGARNGVIQNNRIDTIDGLGMLLARDTVSASSPFYSPAGVNNSNSNLDISGNTITNCGIASNSPDNGVGGMLVSEANFNIKVHHNTLIGNNNIHFQFNGNVYAWQNISDSPVLVGGGTVPVSALVGNGGHFLTADFNGTNSCYGRISDNIIRNGPFRAVTSNTGTAEGWEIVDNKLYNVGSITNVSNGTNINGLISIFNIGNCVVQNNRIRDTRTGVTIPAAVQVNTDAGTIVSDNYVTSTSGLATELALNSATIDARSRFRYTYNPGAITVAAGGNQNFTVNITGLVDGMPTVWDAPDLQGCQVTQCVTAANTLKVYISNPTAGAITIAAANWNFISGG